MSIAASKKSNVIFFGKRRIDKSGNPQAESDSSAFSEHAPAVPIDTCAFTKYSISRYQELMSELSGLAAGRLKMSELKERWWPEFQSFHTMRYQRTGPNGKNTRHPAFDTFSEFLYHVGPKNAPDDTLDRTDHSNPEYGPGLVRWASKRTQSHNRSNTKVLTDTQRNSYSIAEWSRRLGMSASTIRGRLKSGKSVDEALYTPVGGFPRDLAQHPSSEGKFISLWKEAIKERHEQGFFVPSGKDAKQLQLVVDALADGKVWPEKCLAHILTDWRRFTRYAESEYGAWQKPPSVPTIGYLHANIQAAGNFYLESRKPFESLRKEATPMFALPEPTEPTPTPAPDDELLATLLADHDL